LVIAINRGAWFNPFGIPPNTYKSSCKANTDNCQNVFKIQVHHVFIFNLLYQNVYQFEYKINAAVIMSQNQI
jgi:hypothetical protein